MQSRVLSVARRTKGLYRSRNQATRDFFLTSKLFPARHGLLQLGGVACRENNEGVKAPGGWPIMGQDEGGQRDGS